MNELEIESLLQHEGAKRRDGRLRATALAESSTIGLMQRCASFRRRRKALHFLTACCIFVGAILGADHAIAAPSGPAVTGALDTQQSTLVIDSIIQ